MDSVNDLLQKLNILAQTETPSAIEQDLMLDYTRRLYDRLLEMKKAPQIVKVTNAASVPDTPPKAEQPSPKEDETSGLNLPKGQESLQPLTATDPAFGPEEQPEPEAPLTIDIPKEVSSLSFELPQQPEIPPVSPKVGIEEEPEEEPASPTREIPVPMDQQEIGQFEAYQNTPETSSSNGNRGDLRKRIGINDKYLFLNELFNNRKKEYEATLDQINNLSNFGEAKKWITEHPAQTFGWAKGDETVQSFFELVEKYFSFK